MALPIITIKPIASPDILEAPVLPTIAPIPLAAFGEDPTVGVLGDDALDALGRDELWVGGEGGGGEEGEEQKVHCLCCLCGQCCGGDDVAVCVVIILVCLL